MLTTANSIISQVAHSPNDVDVRAVGPLLGLLAAIIRGLSKDSPKPAVLYPMLMKLHLPHEMADQTQALIGIYHPELVFALKALITHDPDLYGPACVAALCGVSSPLGTDPKSGLSLSFARSIWPSARTANSPKVILLLHQLETLIETLDELGFARIVKPLFAKLASALSSLYAMIAQRALQMWENDAFCSHIANHAASAIAHFVPILAGPIAEHWNPSVKRLGFHVLTILHGHNPEEVESVISSHPGSSFDSFAALSAVLDPASSTTSSSSFSSQPSTQESEPTPIGKIQDLTYFDFVFGRVLGEGPFSVVRYAKHVRKAKTPSSQASTFSQWDAYAVKIVDTRNTPEWQALADQEEAILRAIAHPGITNLVAAFPDSSGRRYMVMELAGGGDVFSSLVAVGSFTPEVAGYLAAVALDVLAHLHSLDYVYGDLKPENMVLTEDNRVKLCDFGSCQTVEELTSAFASCPPPVESYGMTVDYLPVSVLTCAEPPSRSSDAYALGLVIYQLLVGRLPDLAGAVPKDGEEISFGAAELFDRGVASRLDDASKDIISSLLAGPEDLNVFRTHPFFTAALSTCDADWDTLHTRGPRIPIGQAKGIAGPQSDPKWRRRKHSIARTPMPSKFMFEGMAIANIDPIEEDLSLERVASSRPTITSSPSSSSSSSPSSSGRPPRAPSTYMASRMNAPPSSSTTTTTSSSSSSSRGVGQSKRFKALREGRPISGRLSALKEQSPPSSGLKHG